MKVNGVTVHPRDPEARLLDYLRDDLGLTGAKEGCGMGECGSCTVLVDGVPVCSCLVLVEQTEDAEVTTVEGLTTTTAETDRTWPGEQPGEQPDYRPSERPDELPSARPSDLAGERPGAGSHEGIGSGPREGISSGPRDGIGSGPHEGISSGPRDGISSGPHEGIAGGSREGIGGRSREGIAEAVREAFVEGQAVQCGFCIAGVVVSACALLERHPDPTDDQIRTGLEGNLCRCTGYGSIVRAVRKAAS